MLYAQNLAPGPMKAQNLQPPQCVTHASDSGVTLHREQPDISDSLCDTVREVDSSEKSKKNPSNNSPLGPKSC